MKPAWWFALAVVTSQPVAAQAEGYWTWEEDGDPDHVPALRFAPSIGLWFGEFDRTARGCRDLGFPSVVAPGPEAPFPEQGFGSLCNTGGSEELAVSLGITAVIRALGPIHISIGLDIALTFPSRFELTDQVVFIMPIGVGITFDELRVRPILQAVLTPHFSVPDLSRGFTYGGEFGLAFRLTGLTDLQLTGGYHTSSDWRMGIIRAGFYLP